MSVDYGSVTEVSGGKASREQLARLYQRYAFAKTFAENKDVLEVACGAGLGLGYLARTARKVVGGDYTERLVQRAHTYYRGRVNLIRLDGHALPFKENSFDVVLLYEAIYYFSNPGQFVRECKRLLRTGGILLVCTVNKDWADFNPSPFSTRYFSSGELCRILSDEQFSVELLGGVEALPSSARGHIISFIKRAAVALHLMPKTMKGKEFLKRLFFGKLHEIRNEIEEGMAPYHAPIPISKEPRNCAYKVLFAVGEKR